MYSKRFSLKQIMLESHVHRVMWVTFVLKTGNYVILGSLHDRAVDVEIAPSSGWNHNLPYSDSQSIKI